MRPSKIVVLSGFTLSLAALALVVASLTLRFGLRITGLEAAWDRTFSSGPRVSELPTPAGRLPVQLQEWLWTELGKNGMLSSIGDYFDDREGVAGRRVMRRGSSYLVDFSGLGIWRLDSLPWGSPRWNLEVALEDNALCADGAGTPWLDRVSPHWREQSLCSQAHRLRRLDQWKKRTQGIEVRWQDSPTGELSVEIHCLVPQPDLALHGLGRTGLTLSSLHLTACPLDRADAKFLESLRIRNLVLEAVPSLTLDLSKARSIDTVRLEGGSLQWFAPPHEPIRGTDSGTSGKDQLKAQIEVHGLPLDHPFARALLDSLGVHGDPAAAPSSPSSLVEAWRLDTAWQRQFGRQRPEALEPFDTLRILLGDPLQTLSHWAGPVRALQRACPAAPGPQSWLPEYNSVLLVGPDIVRVPAGAEYAVGNFSIPTGTKPLERGLTRKEVKSILGRAGWEDLQWAAYAHRRPLGRTVDLFLWLHFDAADRLDGIYQKSETPEGC